MVTHLKSNFSEDYTSAPETGHVTLLACYERNFNFLNCLPVGRTAPGGLMLGCAPNFYFFDVCDPEFFWRAPKFWDLDNKIEPTCDHVTKFHDDRPTELGDLAVKRFISSKT